MRSIVILLSFVISVSTGCKSKKEAASAIVAGATAGKVSHQYQSTGCSTVVIIPAAGEVGEITLIPKDKLSKEFDVDGQEILFDYHTLKMPQPAGCLKGVPAELTNISRKK